ncbi:MAG: site-2 protease family protein [Eubacteriales bacterium]|nr:site-2 protease family protein [Eubacteriales bacterium]
MNRRNNPFNNPMFLGIALVLVMFFIRTIRINHQDIAAWLMSEILMIPGIIIGLSFHEFGHAWVSYRLGDPTPKAQGRLTVNPAAHIDPLGLICLIFAGFGWGVPVQIDPRYYKNRRLGQFLVAIAGVTMNFIVAAVMAVIMKLIITFWPAYASSTVGTSAFQIIYYAFMVNIVLMVFNLLPVPPLDGWNLVTQIFDLEKYDWWYSFYGKGWYLLMALIIFDVTDVILTPMISVVQNFLLRLIVF